LEGKEKNKRRIEVEKKISNISKSFMNIHKSTYKYKEYEMEVEGVHNDVVVVVNENEEIEIIDARYVFEFSPLFEFHQKY